MLQNNLSNSVSLLNVIPQMESGQEYNSQCIVHFCQSQIGLDVGAKFENVVSSSFLNQVRSRPSDNPSKEWNYRDVSEKCFQLTL